MNTTLTKTTDQDFRDAINTCRLALLNAVDTATETVQDASGQEIRTVDKVEAWDNIRLTAINIRFQKLLRTAATLYGTEEEVRTSANAAAIRKLLVIIGYKDASIDSWFEDLEVRFGLRDALVAA